MANEVKTVFTVDTKDAERQIADFEKRLSNVGDADARLTQTNAELIRSKFPIFQQAEDAIKKRNAAQQQLNETTKGSISTTAALGTGIAVTGVALAGAAITAKLAADAISELRQRLEAVGVEEFNKSVTDYDKAWQAAQKTLLSPVLKEVAKDVDSITEAIKRQQPELEKWGEQLANIYAGARQDLEKFTSATETLTGFSTSDIFRAALALGTLGASEATRFGTRQFTGALSETERRGALARGDQGRSIDPVLTPEQQKEKTRLETLAAARRNIEATQAAQRLKFLDDEVKVNAELRKQQAEDAERRRKEAERLQQQLRDLKLSFQDFAATAAGDVFDNPLVKYFSDIGTATERARDQFKLFGTEFANQAAQIAGEAARARAAQAVFQSQVEAANLRRQAAELQGVPFTQIGGFQRRQGGLESALGFALQARAFGREARLDEELAGRNRFGAEFRALREQLISFGEQSRKLDQLARSAAFGELGIFGQEALAKAKLQLLPGQGELAGLLDGPLGGLARSGLSARSDLNRILGAASDRRLRDVIAEQERQNLNQQRAEQLAREIDTTTPGPERRGQIDAFLNLTSDISELSSSLRDRRVDVLNQKADLLENQRAESLVILRNLSKFFTGTGVAVDLAGQANVRLEVFSTDVSASKRAGDKRPTSSDTRGLMDLESITTVLD